MGIPRRQFIKLSSLAAVSAPFLVQDCTMDESRETSAYLSSDDLFNLFKDPPNTARVFVRWWWNGDMLTEKEIIRELDIMKDAGIGGVEINPIRFPDGADPVGYTSLEWLSDEWIHMLDITLQAARERDMICDIIVGSGWPFGGEFLEKEEQTQLMTFETINLEGPGSFEYSNQLLLDKVDPGIHSKYEKVYKEITELRLVPATLNEFEPGTNLDAQLLNDEILINVQEGKFILYYLVKLTGFQAVINGAPGAAGPVLNHYSKEAVKKYLERMSVKLTNSIGVLGNSFRGMFCDSLEMEGANWVDDLPEEFLKRRGYDLKPYLPFVLFKIGHMGNPIEEPYGSFLSPEVEKIIQRVRYDFYITRLELFKERFIDTFNDWCHNNQVKSRIQAYGRGYHPLEASLYIDIPECETWLRETVGTEFDNTGWRGRAYSVINKFVSSGARLASKKLVSCEEITNTSMVFNASLERIKVTGDQSNLSGVTHSILHGFNYSPPEAPFPGWVQYGTFYNERNPWWAYFRLWADYKARLSAVFQQSDPYADIAILHPLTDLWMKFGPQRDPFPVVNYPEYQHNVWEAMQQNGFGCDYVSEQILIDATFHKDRMVYGPRSYTTLILLEVETILPETAEVIAKWAGGGGKIIFIEKIPQYSPGYLNHRKNDGKVASVFQKIMDSNTKNAGLYSAPGDNLITWFQDIAKKFNLKPYMKITNPDKFIQQSYYRSGDLDIFFISNSHIRKSFRLEVSFDIYDKLPWHWDPETGERSLYPFETSPNELSLFFEPAETKLIVFDREKDGEILKITEKSDESFKSIEGPWEIILEHVNGERIEKTIEKLFDFNTNEELRSFAGVITYKTNLNINNSQKFTYLDLGRVEGISEVSMNGNILGVKWYGSHRFPLKNSLIKDINVTEIKVTTVLGNYMKSLEDNKVAQRWTARQEYQSLGLIGPVRLL